MDDDVVVYLAFQGGGAKGVSHIGGLKAVNDMGLKVSGVAGTSAGALVAAMVAAGYSADELFNGADGSHILKTLAGGRFENPTKLFNGWKYLTRLIVLLKSIGFIARLMRSPRWIIRVGSFIVALILMLCVIVIGFDFPGLELVIFFLSIVLLSMVVIRIHQGLSSLSSVREVVDEALRNKLGAVDANVTFEQLRNGECTLPLKLIATNVTDGCLELFSFDTTPDVVVADAVCASICIPFVFKRWSFPFKRKHEELEVERHFIDGGLMSNLPSWTFDEERALNPSAITIAFGLRSDSDKNKKPNWLISALNAVVAGPPQIHSRGINRLIPIVLDTPLDVLDFGRSFEDFKEAVDKASSAASGELAREVTEIPSGIRGILINIREILEELIVYENSQDVFSEHRFRVALALQRPNAFSTLAVTYREGFYLDRYMPVLSLETSLAGKAWANRDNGEPEIKVFGSKAEMSGRVFQDSTWMLSIPITMGDAEDEFVQKSEKSNLSKEDIERSRLAVVLVIDSSAPIEALVQEPGDISSIASFVYENMIEYCRDQDLGRLVRRSVSWL